MCGNAAKCGWNACPTKSIPANEIEKFVVDQIRGIGRDPGLIRETVRQVVEQSDQQVKTLEKEQRGLHRDLSRWNGDLRALIGDLTPGGLARLADIQERIVAAQSRLAEVAAAITTLHQTTIYEADVEKALAAFDPLWETMTNWEQGRALELLLSEVAYDGRSGKVVITFHPSGIHSLAHQEEVIA